MCYDMQDFTLVLPLLCAASSSSQNWEKERYSRSVVQGTTNSEDGRMDTQSGHSSTNISDFLFKVPVPFSLVLFELSLVAELPIQHSCPVYS